MARRFSFDTGPTTTIPGWYDTDHPINVYNVGGLVAHGDISEVYEGTGRDNEPVIIKACRSSSNNDLMENEFNVLTKARTSDQWIKAGNNKFPLPRESFLIDKAEKPRRVTVFARNTLDGQPGLKDPVTLTDVHVAYPQLDPRDAAWMFNRMIDALHVWHSSGYVHGAITPDHLLIEPESHRGQLLDFSYAVKIGSAIKAVSPQWAAHYAPEIKDRLPATPATDIYMAARCMFYLLDISPEPGQTADVPMPLYLLLKACLLGQKQRIQTAQQVHEDFRDVLTACYGARTFRPFAMPAPASLDSNQQ